ncbi:MAG: hypothetical protein IIU58_04595 [Clostridia bacterium]|nr:hypothetical protein [Clostridia bacterium]
MEKFREAMAHRKKQGAGDLTIVKPLLRSNAASRNFCQGGLINKNPTEPCTP